MLEQLGMRETTNAVSNDEMSALHGSHWFKCRKVTCFYFHEGFVDAKSREAHVARHDTPFRCDCSSGQLFAFATRKELDKHMLVYHLRSGNFAATFARLNRAQKRAKVKDEDTKLASPQKHPFKFHCHKCDKKFTRKPTLNTHLLNHDNKKPFKRTVAPNCSADFARHNDLARHLQSVHGRGEKRFVCQGPLKVFFTENNAWGCGKAFPRADALAAHFRSEAGKKFVKPLRDEQALLKEWQKRPADFEVDEEFINSIIDYQAGLYTLDGPLVVEHVDTKNTLSGSSQGTECGSGSPD